MFRRIAFQKAVRHASSSVDRVYSFGSGTWTGAMGIGGGDSMKSNDGDVDDEEVLYEMLLPMQNDTHNSPIVEDISAGWGHTGIITSTSTSPSTHLSNPSNSLPMSSLQLTGRPHELSTLLRLKRLPVTMRDFAIQRTWRHTQLTPRSNDMEGKSENQLWGGEFMTFVLNTLGHTSDFDDAIRGSIMPGLTEFNLVPHSSYGDEEPPTPTPTPSTTVVDVPESPAKIVTSAGLTAALSQDGNLYTLGLNTYGQCGVGKINNNVWSFSSVMGMSSQFSNSSGGRGTLTQEFPVTDVALGLQHGLACNTEGVMYGWGKNERYQLGLGSDSNNRCMAEGQHIKVIDPEDGHELHVTKVASGNNHSACLTDCGRVFAWGRNFGMERNVDGEVTTNVVDVVQPTLIRGLPTTTTNATTDVRVVDISCGSHHLAMLLSDGSVYGVGISTDLKQPLLDEAVCMLPPNDIISQSAGAGTGTGTTSGVRQFTSSFDRTLIIPRDGSQLMELFMWSDETLRNDCGQMMLQGENGNGNGHDNGHVNNHQRTQSPGIANEYDSTWFLTQLQDEAQRRNKTVSLKQISKGWLHTVVVVSEKDI